MLARSEVKTQVDGCRHALFLSSMVPLPSRQAKREGKERPSFWHGGGVHCTYSRLRLVYRLEYLKARHCRRGQVNWDVLAVLQDCHLQRVMPFENHLLELFDSLREPDLMVPTHS